MAKSPRGRPRSRELTEQQIITLRMISQGRSTEEIARQFGVSVATVRYHMRAILAKLHANDRAHALAIAMREGLLR